MQSKITIIAILLSTSAFAQVNKSNQTVILGQSDGGVPTCFATQPASLFTACDCASALINDGGTLPVGAFLALTNNGDGGQPTTCGCEFIQPGANVSAKKYWWVLNDVRDTASAHLTAKNLASGVIRNGYAYREIGQITIGDFSIYNQTTSSVQTITTGIGAAHNTFSIPTGLGRGSEYAYFFLCTTACVASTDGGTLQLRYSVWE